MNKEYEIVDGKVIVLDEHQKKSEREITDNIEEILVCENNIEEIENMIDLEKNNIELNKKNRKIDSNLKISLCIIYAIGTISNILTGNIFSCICNALCSVIWGYNAYFLTIKPKRKNINKSEKSITFLQKLLKKEKENLKELNKNKESNFLYMPNEIKTIDTSKKINDLKHKLFIIIDYENNKKDYIKAYKEGFIQKKFRFLFNDENVELVKELIKNDFPELMNSADMDKQNEHQKSKKLNF